MPTFQVNDTVAVRLPSGRIVGNVLIFGVPQSELDPWYRARALEDLTDDTGRVIYAQDARLPVHTSQLVAIED
jgi:hypothetical protein